MLENNKEIKEIENIIKTIKSLHKELRLLTPFEIVKMSDKDKEDFKIKKRKLNQAINYCKENIDDIPNEVLLMITHLLDKNNLKEFENLIFQKTIRENKPFIKILDSWLKDDNKLSQYLNIINKYKFKNQIQVIFDNNRELVLNYFLKAKFKSSALIDVFANESPYKVLSIREFTDEELSIFFKDFKLNLSEIISNNTDFRHFLSLDNNIKYKVINDKFIELKDNDNALSNDEKELLISSCGNQILDFLNQNHKELLKKIFKQRLSVNYTESTIGIDGDYEDIVISTFDLNLFQKMVLYQKNGFFKETLVNEYKHLLLENIVEKRNLMDFNFDIYSFSSYLGNYNFFYYENVLNLDEKKQELMVSLSLDHLANNVVSPNEKLRKIYKTLIDSEYTIFIKYFKRLEERFDFNNIKHKDELMSIKLKKDLEYKLSINKISNNVMKI